MLNRGIEALRYRDYRLMWVGQFARGTSQWVQMTTIPLLVLHFGGSALHLGLVTALQFGPILILAPIGGVIADRLPKRQALMSLQAVLAVQALALAWIATGDARGLSAVLILAGLFGLANSLEMPIRHSFLAALLPTPALANGIVLAQAAYIVSRLVGPVIASLLVLTVGFPVNFVVGAAGAIVAMILLREIRASGSVGVDSGPQEGVLAALRGGIRYSIANTAIAWSLGLLVSVTAVGMSFQPLLPLYANLVLNDGRGYGLLLSALAVGGLLAAIPMMYLRPVAAMRLCLYGGSGLAGLLVVLAATRVLAVALIVLVAIGFCFLVVTASVNVMVQHAVADDLRGRVMGVYVAILNGGTAVGGLAAGLAAEFVGTPKTMLGAAVLMIGALAICASQRDLVRKRVEAI